MFLRYINFPLLCVSVLVVAINVDGDANAENFPDPRYYYDDRGAAHSNQARDDQDTGFQSTSGGGAGYSHDPMYSADGRGYQNYQQAGGIQDSRFMPSRDEGDHRRDPPDPRYYHDDRRPICSQQARGGDYHAEISLDPRDSYDGRITPCSMHAAVSYRDTRNVPYPMDTGDDRGVDNQGAKEFQDTIGKILDGFGIHIELKGDDTPTTQPAEESSELDEEALEEIMDKLDSLQQQQQQRGNSQLDPQLLLLLQNLYQKSSTPQGNGLLSRWIEKDRTLVHGILGRLQSLGKAFLGWG